MKRKYTLEPIDGEVWYGLDTEDGRNMPFGADNVFTKDLNVAISCNQTAAFMVSNMGRYVWSDRGFKVIFGDGKIEIVSKKSEVVIAEGYGDLKGAYMAASSRHFPADGAYPAETMFRVPQYCTWIQLDNYQTEKGILEYAEGILKKGMPAGELIIDDGWQRTIGTWEFDPDKFSDPKSMCARLGEMGFNIILWICPFIREDAQDRDYLRDNGLLVRDRFGRVAKRKWWNGKDSLLDMSHPAAVKWFRKQCGRLMDDYGIAGFKLDAGDPFYYKDSDKTYGNVDANEQCRLWGLCAQDYRFNELRACFNGGGWGVAQRLCDKSHKWKEGVGRLVPDALAQGIMGYAYTCPDMIGGGQIGDFRGKKEEDLDSELFVRYAQCSALMPMMQYSLDLWNLKDERTAELCRRQCLTHMEYSEYIIELAQIAAKTGEPIIRYLEYEFPHCGYESVTDKFMLGDRYLVAPITEKHVRSLTLELPRGKWRYADREVYEGSVTVDAPLETLPIFEKV